MGFDVFSLDAANHAESANKKANLAANAAGLAANAAGANLDASVVMMQMISEMRDFQHRRFNDLVDANNRRADENQLILKKLDEQNEEIKDLHKKLAELQVQLSNTNR